MNLKLNSSPTRYRKQGSRLGFRTKKGVRKTRIASTARDQIPKARIENRPET